LGPYEILGPIGKGGMGVVYRARDPRLDRQVAIKLLPPGMAADREARERLRFEAMAAAALDHPFICKIFEIGEHEDAVFLVMEYSVGETLTHRLRKNQLSFPSRSRQPRLKGLKCSLPHSSPKSGLEGPRGVISTIIPLPSHRTWRSSGTVCSRLFIPL
jgi:serine/threonine protein kinase